MMKKWTFAFADPNHLRELLFHGNVTSKLASHWPRTAHAGLLASFVATDTSPSVVRIKSYDDDLKQVCDFLM